MTWRGKEVESMTSLVIPRFRRGGLWRPRVADIGVATADGTEAVVFLEDSEAPQSSAQLSSLVMSFIVTTNVSA
jgi:hypothetical protein